MEAEDDIAEEDDSPEVPISLNTLRQQMDEIAVERLGLAARTETDFLLLSEKWTDWIAIGNAENGITKIFVAMYHWSIRK